MALRISCWGWYFSGKVPVKNAYSPIGVSVKNGYPPPPRVPEAFRAAGANRAIGASSAAVGITRKGPFSVLFFVYVKNGYPPSAPLQNMYTPLGNLVRNGYLAKVPPSPHIRNSEQSLMKHQTLTADLLCKPCSIFINIVTFITGCMCVEQTK